MKRRGVTPAASGLSRRAGNTITKHTNAFHKIQVAILLLFLAMLSMVLYSVTSLSSSESTGDTGTHTSLQQFVKSHKSSLREHSNPSPPESITVDELITHSISQNPEKPPPTTTAFPKNKDGVGWVEGEKRVKKRLTKLLERQSRGLDLGVPITTRFLGDATPLWEGEDLSNTADNTEEHSTKEQSHTFPIPTTNKSYTIGILPTFGHHRPSVDAILAFAEGYDLPQYVIFLETLRQTGYTGDVVLSVATLERLARGVEGYLRSYVLDIGEDKEGMNVVVYTVPWLCTNKKGETVNGVKEGMSLCTAPFYHHNGIPIPDPRAARPVATARYELYWIWSTRYEGESMMLLIDSRDAYFQLPPFEGVERSGGGGGGESGGSGILHFFEENSTAINIGKSSFNARWIREAYGKESFDKIKAKTVICSGTTMGEQIAIESYLRAMVLQFDETHCILKGCDQGFHNYIHYFHVLENATGIQKTVTHEQGSATSAVNNLAALRDKPLKEHGLWDPKRELILNWDGSTSAIVHQYDRDKAVNIVIKKRKDKLVAEWKKTSAQAVERL